MDNLPDGSPARLFPHQKKILEACLTPDSDGRLPYRQITYSCVKKSGKTELGAMIASWFSFSGIASNRSEIYLAANDIDQAQGRVYKALKTHIESSPILQKECSKIHERLIELKNGLTINAIAGDYAGAAGSNPELTIFDELWAYKSEAARRLYEETTPSPARMNSLRVIVTYAGIMGESDLLEEIYKYCIPDAHLEENKRKHRDPRFPSLPVYTRGDSFLYWDHVPRMPWQTPDYYLSQRNQAGFRQSAYLRIHENRWVESEEGLPMHEWDSCVEMARTLRHYTWPGPNKNLQIAVGVDASTKKDRAAVTSCFKKDGMIWLGPRKWFQPSKESPLQFEDTIEKFVLELHQNYSISVLYYDPWQFERSAQLLRQRGIPCHEFVQTQPNQIQATEYTMDLLRGARIVIYPDEELRREATMCSIKEIPGRGRRIMKDNDNKKIDSIISMCMAALACGNHCPDSIDLRGQFLLLGRSKMWNPTV